jgi:hypothetical protein
MTIRICKLPATLLVLLITLLSFSLQAQDWKEDKKINVLFGLTQPLFLKGFNIEGNYIHNRLIFDYSHGVSLDFSGNSVTDDLKRQNVAVHMPWTTGFGIGYRLKEWINVRIEPKWHRFEFYYNDEVQNSTNEITSYNTMSLGIGLYGSFQLFKNKASFIKNIVIAPNIRYWPTIACSMEGEQYSYFNKYTNKNEEIKILDPGFGFTPFVFNVSIGYSFDVSSK